MVELLQRNILFVLLFYSNQIFDILDQMQQLFIAFVLIEGDYGDTVLELVEIGISGVVH